VIASPESWSRPADPLKAAVVAVVAVGLFLGAWGLLHVGFYTEKQIEDTPVYQRYGDAMRSGQVPYRDFRLEYPPGALPVFVVPSLTRETEGDLDGYDRGFQTLMWLCGAGVLLAMAALLDGLGASSGRIAAALCFAALAPLALGSVVLSRFDRWTGFAVLALATLTKLYPAVLLPLFLADVWRRSGRRTALQSLGLFAGVVALGALPFVILGPDGFAWSLGRQLSRPLQIESLGSGFLLAAHQVFGVGITMRSGHGSQNLVGTGPDVLAGFQTLLQSVALIGIWVWYARGSADRERLVRASAAAVCAFIALGKVFSPQFLIWLVPLVPLVRGRRGLVASGLLLAVMVVTQAWFPFRYWALALAFDPAASWLVLARDLLMVGLLVTLLVPFRGVREGTRTT
jgi:hypothetical protein